MQGDLKFWDLLLFASVFCPSFGSKARGRIVSEPPDAATSLCQFLLPLRPRQYSIACAPPEEGKPAVEVSLLVGKWRYELHSVTLAKTVSESCNPIKTRRLWGQMINKSVLYLRSLVLFSEQDSEETV